MDTETQRRGRRGLIARLAPWIAGALALVLYLLTMAPELTWAHDGADGGDLIAASMTLGVPHPSGYPTYVLLGRLFGLLPFGTIAYRYHLFSAVAAALSVVLVSLSAQRLIEREQQTAPNLIRNNLLAAGIAGLMGLAWATGPILWSQALIAEVYALLSLFASATLYLALSLDPGRVQSWLLVGLWVGLGLGAHLTLLLMLPGLVILWERGQHGRWRRWGALVVGLLVGASVFVYLPLAAASDPPVNWGDPETWAGFWWVVSGRPYRGYLLGLPLSQLPSRLGAWLAIMRRQHTVVGLALAGLGVWHGLERGRQRLVIATGAMLALFSLYSITYDTVDSYVYLLPALLMLPLWMLLGTMALLQEAARWPHRRRTLIALVLLLLLALPLVSVLRHGPRLDLSHDTEATMWLDAVLDRLPQGALVITGEDGHTFALDYALWAQGRRRDLLVVDGDLLSYGWYKEQLRQRHAGIQLSAENGLVALVALHADQRDIYFTTRRPEIEAAYMLEPNGPLWRVTGQR